MKRAASIGMFDGVHLGHQDLVRQLRQHAELHLLEPAIFTFFTHPLQLIAPQKAPKLLTTPDEKAQLLIEAGAKIVFLEQFDDNLRNLTAREYMQKLKDDYDVELLLIGFNHRMGKGGEGNFAVCKQIGEEIGINVMQATEANIPELELPLSSSAIRKALADGDLAKANSMLGRCYALDGTVQHGLCIGRTIGFPTANVKPALESQLIPKCGVYGCRAKIADKTYAAMVNIGIRPTLGENLDSTIEAHLIGFQGNLYGKSIRLEFIERVRDEKKFESLDALTAQLKKDQEKIAKFALK